MNCYTITERRRRHLRTWRKPFIVRLKITKNDLEQALKISDGISNLISTLYNKIQQEVINNATQNS